MIKGFKCACGEVPFSTCSKCELECRPRPYLDWVIDNQRDIRSLLSPSMIWGCPRKTLLLNYNEVYVTPDSRYWLFYGTVVHSVLEGWNVPGAIKEKRFQFDLGEFHLSGQPDLLVPCEGGYTLVDFKTTNTIYADKEGKVKMEYLLKDAYIGQLSVYAHGLRQNGIEVKNAKLYYFARSSKSCQPCISVPVKIDEKMVEDAIVRCRDITHYYNSKTLPSYQDCQKEFRWMCENYCEVNEMCWKDAQEKGEM